MRYPRGGDRTPRRPRLYPEEPHAPRRSGIPRLNLAWAQQQQQQQQELPTVRRQPRPQQQAQSARAAPPAQAGVPPDRRVARPNQQQQQHNAAYGRQVEAFFDAQMRRELWGDVDTDYTMLRRLEAMHDAAQDPGEKQNLRQQIVRIRNNMKQGLQQTLTAVPEQPVEPIVNVPKKSGSEWRRHVRKVLGLYPNEPYQRQLTIASQTWYLKALEAQRAAESDPGQGLNAAAMSWYGPLRHMGLRGAQHDPFYQAVFGRLAGRRDQGVNTGAGKVRGRGGDANARNHQPRDLEREQRGLMAYTSKYTPITFPPDYSEALFGYKPSFINKVAQRWIESGGWDPQDFIVKFFPNLDQKAWQEMYRMLDGWVAKLRKEGKFAAHGHLNVEERPAPGVKIPKPKLWPARQGFMLEVPFNYMYQASLRGVDVKPFVRNAARALGSGRDPAKVLQKLCADCKRGRGGNDDDAEFSTAADAAAAQGRVGQEREVAEGLLRRGAITQAQFNEMGAQITPGAALDRAHAGEPLSEATLLQMVTDYGGWQRVRNNIRGFIRRYLPHLSPRNLLLTLGMVASLGALYYADPGGFATQAAQIAAPYFGVPVPDSNNPRPAHGTEDQWNALTPMEQFRAKSGSRNARNID